MKKIIVKSILLFAVCAVVVTGCNTTDLGSGNTTTLMDVTQTSGQLASGTSFTISGSSTSTTSTTTGPGSGPQHKGGRGPHGLLDGTNLLAPTDQLLAIIEAESAGDFRGLRMHHAGGATVTNYDIAGNVVTLPQPEQNSGGPEGCSFSGKQFPRFDSLLLRVARTVIDFGTGVTNDHGDITITRSGKIIITRSGDSSSKTETVTFENYKVNGAKIEGTKSRVNTFDETTGSGLSATHVVDGKITFSDGTVATWTSTKQRKSTIVLDSKGRPSSGQIVTDGSTVVSGSDGVIYSHTITKSIIENVACGREHHGPVSGTVATVYNADTVSVDFGDGSCNNNTVTITLNGVATTRTLGE